MAALVAGISAALAIAAAPTSVAGGNVAAVRADVKTLETRLAGTIATVRTHRSPQVKLGQLEGPEGRAVEQFPPVFGRAYAQTFTPLICIGTDPARAASCAAALVRVLGTSAASRSARTAARKLLSAARSLFSAARRRGAPGRAATRVSAAEAALTQRFPNVFGLPYTTTFAPLDCIDASLAKLGPLLRRRAPNRKVLLTWLRRASGCAKRLEDVLATIKTAGPPTAPPTPTSPTSAGSAPPASGATPMYLDTHYSFAERAADLVSRMTLAEKVAQLRTNSAPAIPRLGVQQYTYWSEGQHGVNALGANTNHGAASGGPHATSFPANFAAAMTWDPALMYEDRRSPSPAPAPSSGFSAPATTARQRGRARSSTATAARSPSASPWPIGGPTRRRRAATW